MPSFKTKERARVSDTDINDLMDEGVYTFEAGFWSNIPPCGKKDVASVFTAKEGEITCYSRN